MVKMQVLRNLMAGLLIHVNTFYRSQYVCVDCEVCGQAFVVWSYAHAAPLHYIVYSRVTLCSRAPPTLHPLLIYVCHLEHFTQPLGLLCVSESLRKEVLQIVPEFYRVQCTWPTGS